MEKGRHRFSVTADANGLTNSGISRSLASRPPYRSTIAKVHAENDREPDEKCKEFYAFQTACQYVDEVREVIP
jgi:hypothetical protein